MHMKVAVVAVFGALSLSACATASQNFAVEDGYPRGALAAAAIQRGDWGRAEQLLKADHGVRADDPARLINLGRVYMATGRSAEAIALWRQVINSRPVNLQTADGRMAPTTELAREAIARYGGLTETAAR